MILHPPRERPTIYTKVHATSSSLVKKYLLNNSVCQNKVRTPFDPEILPSSTQRMSQTAISSERVPTPPVDSLGSLHDDRLYMNMWFKCLDTNSIMENCVIGSYIQLSKHYVANAYATRK